MSHGTYIVATRSGYVLWESHIIDVVPQYELPEVEAASTPLVVDGDLYVLGSIRGRSLVVSGNLIVAGDVRQAAVIVGGAIQVQGTTENSTVMIGLEQYANSQAWHHIARIIDGLYDLELTMTDLERIAHQSVTGPRFGTTLAQVIATKFTDVLESVQWLNQALTWPGLRWREAYTRLVHELREHLSEARLRETFSLAALLSLRTHLELLDSESLVEEIRLGRFPLATQLQHVMQSQIDSGGDVTIGMARASRISAASVIIQEAVVGGFVSGEHQIRAAQLGTEEGTETTVEITAPQGLLETEVAFPGVVLVHHGTRQILTTPQVGVRLGPEPQTNVDTPA